MDRNVTVRFYHLTGETQGAPTFDAILRGLETRAKLQRHADVGDGIILRLERLSENDGLLIGDFTRVQVENLPGHVTDDDINPLPVDQIGHHAAFCYDPTCRVMAVQFDVKMAIGRICRYVGQFGNTAHFSYLPVLLDGTLERFEAQTPTKFHVRVANVERFRAEDNGGLDFESALEAMGAMFDAPTIEVTVSTRGLDGSLNKETVLNSLRRLLRLKAEGVPIKSITAETLEAVDPFNFIQQLLKESAILELPRNDPQNAREVRMGHVKECYERHRAQLRAAYEQLGPV